MSISLIAAVSKNGVIGKANDLPWDIPEDRKHFRDMTMNKVVLMGRKTFDSILARLGKPLPGRKNVVVTRGRDLKGSESLEVFHTIEEALEKYRNDDVFVIGGGQIYEQTIGVADTLYITHVNQEVKGDAFFPKIQPGKWEKIEEQMRDGYSFATYKKRML